MSPVSPARPSGATTARWALPALIILLIQVALYVWMAPRGFEFTDESYYYHNFLHWREFTGTVTFFGAYFEWPFRAMGMSIAGSRILTLLLVLASGAVLMHQVLRFSLSKLAGGAGDDGNIPHVWWYLVAPMASAMMYFGYLSTLRAPSYNLLSLCSMALSTACLLHTLEQQARGRSSLAAPLLYGVALGACFLSKATTSLVLVLGHTLFFVAVNRSWAWKRLLEIFFLVVAGFAVNFVVLTVQFPGWLPSLREGIEIMRMRGGYGALELLNRVRWDIQHALISGGAWLLLFGVLFAVVRRKLGADSRGAISLLSLVLVGASMAVVTGERDTRLWLFAMAATSLGLWSLELLGRPGRTARNDRTELALMALLLFLPVAFSFGTNMSVLTHSAIAAVFAYCAVYLRLYRLWHQGMLTHSALAASVSLLCVPALAAQVLALTDVGYTYRQLSPLGEQHVPVALGTPATVLRVDPRTEKSLKDISAMVQTAGFKPGQDVLDFTGDGPGFIYAVGAKPLGSPWMIGGYSGSGATASRIIEKVNAASIRGAWLLTSTNNPLRLMDWESRLARLVGPNSHKMVASIDIANPYRWNNDAPETVNLQLWKPATPVSEEQ
jgi:hypothetical protein